jgi:hypothetical protein
MKSITRLVTAVVAVMLTVAILCPAQDLKPKDLGKGAAFNGKNIEMKDNGEVAYLLSFTAGKDPDRSVRLRSRRRRTGSTSSSSRTPAGPTR